MKDVFKNWRVILVALCILTSLYLIFNKGLNDDGLPNGLEYGTAFAGGVEMHLHLERAVSADEMQNIKGLLDYQLNSMALKDIQVLPVGNQFILIQVAKASEEDISRIRQILEREAKFEERIDGRLAVMGKEIEVDLGPRGSGIEKWQSGYRWVVAVKHTGDAPCRFQNASFGAFYSLDSPKNRPIDMFIDRPENTTIMMTRQRYDLIKGIPPTESDFYFGNDLIEIIENRSLIPVIVFENDTSALMDKLNESRTKGFYKVILAGDEDSLSEDLRNTLESNDFETVRKPVGNLSYAEWVKELTGIKSSPRLNINPITGCVYEAQLTGFSATLEDAMLEIEKNKVLFSLGNLPVKATPVGETHIPHTVGTSFIKYSIIAGMFAIITVALVIFLYYRRPFILLSIMATDISEVTITLGFASLVHWNLDLPAIAGIITAIGTGVNDQIVITDETLKREQQRVISITERLKRAFFIIFTAAATIVAAMMPLMTVYALKGFAFTTIVGVLIGVFITRPAYGKVIEAMLKDEGA